MEGRLVDAWCFGAGGRREEKERAQESPLLFLRSSIRLRVPSSRLMRVCSLLSTARIIPVRQQCYTICNGEFVERGRAGEARVVRG